ncbi:MAG: hypothetical protein MR669_01065 [Selenomonadaceae bacterium]|nr:hypothetical protein [Selenomonadaceae bacterium]
MATKSFLKNIDVKGKKNVVHLVQALEKAESLSHSQPDTAFRPVTEIRGKESIEKFLAGYNWSTR